MSTPAIERFGACRYETIAFKLWAFGVFAIALLAIRRLNGSAWSEGKAPSNGVEQIAQWAGLAWCATLPAVAVAMAAMFLPRRKERDVQPLDSDPPVAWRIVSRGRNSEALADTVEAIRRAMIAAPLFKYRIEVVTDEPVDIGAGADLFCYVVPSEYQTENASRWKARALVYAYEISSLSKTGWIVHLDEESWPSRSCVHGVASFVARHDRRARPPIGQGAILYFRHLTGRRLMPKILTLADSLRTGDDICRFRLQYRMGVAPMGMHGSYIVVRNDVEQSIGLDVGYEGSITEDAWFAMAAQQAGHRFDWVDGYVVEQAPETVRDLVKQRRRWWNGLFKVALYAPCPAWVRVTLFSFLLLWGAAVFGSLYTVANIVLGLETAGPIDWIGSVCFAWYLTMYTMGLRLNLAALEDETSTKIPWTRRVIVYTAQIVLVPVFGIIEGVAVLYGIILPERGFTVITKSGSARTPAHAEPAVGPAR